MRGKRIFAALLAVLMVLTSGVIPVRAASNPELPDLSAFLGSRYTQNVEGTYTDYVTCTYSEDLGTGPLEEFLELLQEDRYRLKLTNTSKEYQDSWDKAGTCKDYFFDYTGSDSRITSITTSNGYAYDVRVTLYTYSDKDYNAIVLYREKDFVLKDSGVHLGDKAKNTIPALHDFFGDALRKEAGNGETAYFFAFSSLPASEIKELTRALEKLNLTATEQLKVGKSCLQLFHVNETVVITLWWHDADEELEIILHDDALKAAGYSQKTTQIKKPPVAEESDNGGESPVDWGKDDDTIKWRPCTSCTNGKVKCTKCDGKGYKIKKESVANYSGKGPKYTETKEWCSCSFGKVDCNKCDNGKVYY